MYCSYADPFLVCLSSPIEHINLVNTFTWHSTVVNNSNWVRSKRIIASHILQFSEVLPIRPAVSALSELGAETCGADRPRGSVPAPERNSSVKLSDLWRPPAQFVTCAGWERTLCTGMSSEIQLSELWGICPGVQATSPWKGFWYSKGVIELSPLSAVPVPYDFAF